MILKRSKKTKHALVASVVSATLCCGLLLGTTFAWFTDSVTNTGNTIQAGTLDIELNDGETEALFSSKDFQWEPGRSQKATATVSNEGSLWLKYNIGIADLNHEGGGNDADIADVLDVYLAGSNAQNLVGAKYLGTVKELSQQAGSVEAGVLAPKGYSGEDGEARKTLTIVIKMQESAGNDYQGAKASFNVVVNATQTPYEEDGFGNKDYDALASGYPDQDWDLGGSVSVQVNDSEDTVLPLPGVQVTVPKDAATADTLTLNVSKGQKPDGISVDDKTTTITYSFEIEGLADENTTPIPVVLYVGEDLEDVTLYCGESVIENATYDSKTGYVSFETASFDQPITASYVVVNDGNFSGGNGTPEHPYLISNKDDLMKIGYKGTGTEDGKDYFYNQVFRLTNDIDMENTPIKNLGSFRGLLDGDGHKLINVNFTSKSETGYGSTVGLFASLNGGSKTEIYEATTEEEKASEYCYEINGKQYIITSGAVVDLTIESGKIYSDANGAVSPLGASQNTAYVINVTNNVDIEAEGEAYFIAGIVSGTRGTGLVINCTNNGDITYRGTPSSSLVVGGITAQLYGGSSGAYPDILNPYSAAVYGCVNNGNIYAEGKDVGGIVGQTHGYDAALKKAIINCTNNGNISGKENVGGIIGRNSSTGTSLYLLNNKNNGKVSLLEAGVEGTSGELFGKNDGTIYDKV